MGAHKDLVYHEGYGWRPRSLREHWFNCCERPDEEMIEIDRMEDELTDSERQRAQPIRRLIGRFETCHWNSDRWLERILQAIAEEQVPPTSGRPRTQHPLAQMLGHLHELLTHWVTRSTTEIPQCTILGRSGVEILRSLGTWTPLKAWVIQRVLDGLERHMCTQRLLESPQTPLTRFYMGGLTLDSPEADQYFPDSLDLLAEARSRKIKVQGENDARAEEHSLAYLSGWLYPCNKYYFLFLFALFEYLGSPDEERILPSPFCGNISQDRRRRYYRIINALRRYLGKPPESSLPGGDSVPAHLGNPTIVKRWLVASLEKTLREQTPPPPHRENGASLPAESLLRKS